MTYVFDAILLLAGVTTSWAITSWEYRRKGTKSEAEPLVYSVGQTVLVQPDLRSNFWFEGTIVEIGNHQYRVGEFNVFSALVRVNAGLSSEREWWVPVAQVRPTAPPERTLMPERQSPFRD